MEKRILDRNWTFSLEGSGLPHGAVVDLPHDFSIRMRRAPDAPSGAAGGFFPGGLATYEKSLTIPADWEGREVWLEFEGVYMNAAVHVNNHLLCRHPYGYTGFHCDMTPVLRCGAENHIRVTVNDTAQPNSRWYSGAGIYRHVWLLTGEKIHIRPWGVFAAAQRADGEEAVLSVETEVENRGGEARTVRLSSTLCASDGTAAASEETAGLVEAGQTRWFCQRLFVPHPRLWSPETPYLYRLQSRLLPEQGPADRCETPVGLRTLAFDAARGFRLNGERVLLKGACVHHDCGLLGAASYDRAEARKVELLKVAGYNAVRCAHNPPSPAFLDACDRLGMLVIDEAFDCWRESKNPCDYSLFFDDWWERDLRSMVLRDRNHPSVILWSTGNEVPERSGLSGGYATSRMLAGAIRRLDDTRAVTNAINGLSADPLLNGLEANMLQSDLQTDLWGKKTEPFIEPLDVAGYNYMEDRYESDARTFPGRVIFGSETFASAIARNWELVERLPSVIGDFVWTGLDYLGESGLGHVWYHGETGFFGGYPWHQAHCGDLDICGFKRPQSYYRDCVWGVSKRPYIAVQPPRLHGVQAEVSRWDWPDVVDSWTWPGYEGRPVRVEVYSADDEVELFLDGISLGRRPAGKAAAYRAVFETFYRPGRLAAVGYSGGVKRSATQLQTAGRPASLSLRPDRPAIGAAFGDLCYVEVRALDENGVWNRQADDEIHFHVDGPGTLLAVGSGNPLSEEPYVGETRRLFEGRAMAVLRSDGPAGVVTLTASADGMPADVLSVTAERVKGE